MPSLKSRYVPIYHCDRGEAYQNMSVSLHQHPFGSLKYILCLPLWTFLCELPGNVGTSTGRYPSREILTARVDRKFPGGASFRVHAEHVSVRPFAVYYANTQVQVYTVSVCTCTVVGRWRRCSARAFTYIRLQRPTGCCAIPSSAAVVALQSLGSLRAFFFFGLFAVNAFIIIYYKIRPLVVRECRESGYHYYYLYCIVLYRLYTYDYQ